MHHSKSSDQQVAADIKESGVWGHLEANWVDLDWVDRVEVDRKSPINGDLSARDFKKIELNRSSNGGRVIDQLLRHLDYST